MLGLRRIDLYLQFERGVGDAELPAIRELVRRRGRGEPVAYITGTREFFSRSFEVTPDVLIPRPETETLVECVLEEVRELDAVRIADLGTGSGCIAVTLAAELPRARCIATDVSEVALEVARRNAARHAVSERIEFVHGTWGDAVAGAVDVVVSNPPYVRSDEMTELPVDVADFEPHLALEAGESGLEAYRAIFASLNGRLSTPALIALEVDPRRAPAVAELLVDAFTAAEPRLVPDLTGRSRVVVARGGAAT